MFTDNSSDLGYTNHLSTRRRAQSEEHWHKCGFALVEGELTRNWAERQVMITSSDEWVPPREYTLEEWKEYERLEKLKETNTGNKYDKGLNLFDAPNIGEGLFVGREAELREMESIIKPKSNSPGRRVLVLGGIGGIGKTQLAINYAKRHRDSYSSTFWLNASSEATVKSSLRSSASRIFPPETVCKLGDGQLWIYLSAWLSDPENTRWLLIFDN